MHALIENNAIVSREPTSTNTNGNIFVLSNEHLKNR